MNIFGSKKKDKLILVFHIGSSFVAGSIFKVEKSGIPKIVFSCIDYIKIKESVDIDSLMSSVATSLKVVVNKIYQARVGAPSSVHCVISSPWYISENRVISLKKNTDFTVSQELVNDLVNKEISLFEDKYLIKSSSTKDNFARTIEVKNIKTKLNGYEVFNISKQTIKELEITVFISICKNDVLMVIENIIKENFHFEKIFFSSSLMVFFSTILEVFKNKESFLLLDVGGEVTEISLIKKNLLCESVSFPIGRNFFTRGVACELKCSLDEARSYIYLFKDGHAEKTIEERLNPIMDKLKIEWLNSFQKSLASLSNNIFLPSTIYVAIDKDLAYFFADLIKSEQFSQYVFTETKFEVVFLNTEQLHSFVVFEENTIRDSFLASDTIYINHFLN